MSNINQLLKDLIACPPAQEWAQNKSWEEIYTTCHRGDWLLWLFKRVNPDDLQRLTLAKGHCANTVKHLMKDERSIKSVDAAIAFGEGKISENELNAAYSAAYSAAASATYAATYAATYSAAYSASDAAYSASDAAAYAAAATYAATYAAAYAYAYDAADDAYDAADDARKANRQLTADICRKYLPIEIWNIKNDEI